MLRVYNNSKYTNTNKISLFIQNLNYRPINIEYLINI